jgi:probable rRNA maturation factor
MAIRVVLQRAWRGAGLPRPGCFRKWVSAALSGRRTDAEIVIRIVDEVEGARLNQVYRGRQGPTNVLSFPFELPAVVRSDLLGDLVICGPLVLREAAAQAKLLEAHWAHLVVHGVLHLLGFDHQEEGDAGLMERTEVSILEDLGYPDPYLHREDA